MDLEDMRYPVGESQRRSNIKFVWAMAKYFAKALTPVAGWSWFIPHPRWMDRRDNWRWLDGFLTPVEAGYESFGKLFSHWPHILNITSPLTFPYRISHVFQFHGASQTSRKWIQLLWESHRQRLSQLLEMDPASSGFIFGGKN